MPDLEAVRNSLNQYITPSGAAQFFRSLGYPVLQTPLPYDDVLDEMPQQAKEAVGSLNQIFQSDGEPPFRIFHAELRHPSIRRTDIRYFLEAFYRRYPQGENLFVFSPKDHYDDLAFVSPLRLPDPRDPQKVRLWLRVLQVRRDQPYRTDLEVLERIRADDLRDPQAIWERHKKAFSIQRVTEQFFQDYSRVFREVQNVLRTSHEENGPDWARDYAHQVLNRIMFLYFIAPGLINALTNAQPGQASVWACGGCPVSIRNITEALLTDDVERHTADGMERPANLSGMIPVFLIRHV
jgi:hypothetical protein